MRKVKPMPMVPNMNMINPMQNYYMGVKNYNFRGDHKCFSQLYLKENPIIHK